MDAAGRHGTLAPSVTCGVPSAPVHRLVALKVLKRGMETRMIATRVRAEMPRARASDRRMPTRQSAALHSRVSVPTNETRLRFTRAMRLSGGRAFSAVFDAKVRRGAGPLVIFAKPNALTHGRLGLTVGRRVGNAVVRNRIKRLLREAFRLEQHALPPGFDLVVVVKPHPALELDRYRALLSSSARGLAHAWTRRSAPASSEPTLASDTFGESGEQPEAGRQGGGRGTSGIAPPLPSAESP